MGCKNYTSECQYKRHKDMRTCPCNSYEDTETDEEFAKRLKYKVGDFVKWGNKEVMIDKIDITAHGWDDSCLPYRVSMWCSESELG